MTDILKLLGPTPREQSILIWGFILLVVVVMKSKSFMPSLFNLVRVFFNPKLQIMIWTTLSWIAFSCYLLWYFGLWNITILKETILLAVTTGVAFTFRAVSTEGTKLLQVLQENFKVSAILAFFVNMYSFDLWIELIIFPVMSFVVLMSTMAEIKEEFKGSRKIISSIVAFCGLLYFGFSVWLFKKNMTSDQLIIESVKMLLPLFLYFISIPVIYFWSMVSMYQNLFLLFNARPIRDKPDLVTAAKRKIYRSCHINAFRLKALVINPLFRARVIDAETVDEIEANICLAFEGKLKFDDFDSL